MPAPNGSPFALDRQSGRWRIKCRDGSLFYFYRAVMEGHLRRHLRPDEHVHHLNGDQTDDRIENLQLIDGSTHGAIHGRDNWAKRKAAWKYEWSEQHPRCVECGTTERKHRAHGRCDRCAGRIASRRSYHRKKARAAA